MPSRTLHAPNLALSFFLVASFLVGLPSGASASGLRTPDVGTTWPVLHGDPENRDFVPLAGAVELAPAWSALQVRAAATVVAIGPEGNLYTLTLDEGPCHLWALDRDGNVLWCSDAVRTAFATPAVSEEGAVYVSDGVEVFRFEADGTLTWRVPADATSLGGVFTPEGFVVFFDAEGVATAYDPHDGDVVARLPLPSGTLPRPDPLPANLQSFQVGGPAIGIDPAFVDTFIDRFFDFDTAVGNNIPAVTDDGRMFVGVSVGPGGPAAGEGVLYGVDFTPPASPGGSGELSIACQAPLGLASGTSPAVSRDGERVYTGDSDGVLTAFRTDDCSVAWQLPLEAPSLASPTVDLDGRLFLLVDQKVFAFRDRGDGAEVLWQTDVTPLALERGFVSGRFNSVLARAADVLYGAASFFAAAGPSQVPAEHALVSLDPATGEILATASLGEESDSTVSVGPFGLVYVASKPLVKGVLLGTPLAPFVPPPQSGIFAFEPASYGRLVGRGLDVALDFLDRAGPEIEADARSAAAGWLRRAARQLAAVTANTETALERDELDPRTARVVSLRAGLARHLLGIAAGLLERPVPTRAAQVLAELAERLVEAARRAAG